MQCFSFFSLLSGDIKGGGGISVSFAHQRLCPPCPKLKEKLLKSAIFGIFCYKNYPLGDPFCPLDAPPPISGAAIAFWPISIFFIHLKSSLTEERISLQFYSNLYHTAKIANPFSYPSIPGTRLGKGTQDKRPYHCLW